MASPAVPESGVAPRGGQKVILISWEERANREGNPEMGIVSIGGIANGNINLSGEDRLHVGLRLEVELKGVIGWLNRKGFWDGSFTYMGIKRGFANENFGYLGMYISVSLPMLRRNGIAYYNCHHKTTPRLDPAAFVQLRDDIKQYWAMLGYITNEKEIDDLAGWLEDPKRLLGNK